MRTPSLRTRMVMVGLTVVVVVVTGVNALLYLTFRVELRQNLAAFLEERAEVVTGAAENRSGPDLAARLTQLGVRAIVRSPDGAVYRADPPSPILGKNLPAREGDSDSFVSRDVRLADGSVVTVFARRTGVDDASHKLLVLEGVGLVVATLVAALLLLRSSHLVLRPLHQIAASARRTAGGQRGERLQPDRPTTTLGQLAAAYDDMLESLELSETRANDAQLESELHYLHLRQVIETANAAFIAMDANGIITDWNNKAEEVFGWTRSAMIGSRLVDTLIPRELRSAHTAGLRRFLESGEHRVLGDTVEFEAVHRDGRLVPVEISTWVTYTGDAVTFNAFARDTTERRKGEEAVGRLASIVESAQEAILTTSLDGTILTWNFGAERTYGYTAEEAVGKSVAIIVPPDRSDEIDRVFETVGGGQSVGRYEAVRRRKEGTDVEVALTVSPIFDSWGEVVGASMIARDITEQRRMARALDQTLSALERALDDTRRSEERSKQFLADAAHQLRAPIAGIRASAETLLRGAREEGDSERLLVELVRETSRAARLVTQLLQLARLDQGPIVQPCPSDFTAVCKSEVERTRMLAPDLEIVLEIPGVPDRARKVDGNALTEILSNLLDNARRHARERISVSVEADDTNIHIRVTDDGSGVPADVVDRIFDRFVSMDGRGGSGLGLAIGRALARAQGGDLVYGGDAGGGATFCLTLPVTSRIAEDVEMRT